jgi:hypothetical protein
MNYAKIKHNSIQLISLTGLNNREFESLSEEFSVEFTDYITRFTIEGKTRRRMYKPRKTSNLSTIEDKLLFTLIFLKTSPLQEHHAAGFGISQPKANCTSICLFLCYGKLSSGWENCQREDLLLWSGFYGVVKMSCLTEPSALSKDHPIMKWQMSIIVVKKTHSVKNNVLALPNLRIVWMSQTYDGKIHDKHICDRELLTFPQGIRLWQDGGFLGYNPGNVIIKMPVRKPRGKELTQEQKDKNKNICSFRVKVEHAIGRVKIFRIVKERYRCHKLFFEDLIFEVACGLHNFKLSCRINI